MHYYVDGYNLMFRLLNVSGDLSDEREYIIHDLSKKAEALDLKMTLVFDAQYQFGEGSRSHFRNLEIVFTQHGEIADEYILNALHETNHPQRETVVTSDKSLARLARNTGAKTEGIETFISWLNKRYDKKPQKKEVEPVPNTLNHVSDYDRWLKIFEEKFKNSGA